MILSVSSTSSLPTSVSTSVAIDYQCPTITVAADHHGCGGVKVEDAFQISVPEFAQISVPDRIRRHLEFDKGMFLAKVEGYVKHRPVHQDRGDEFESRPLCRTRHYLSHGEVGKRYSIEAAQASPSR